LIFEISEMLFKLFPLLPMRFVGALECIFGFFRAYFKFLIFLLGYVRILYVEQVAFFQVVEEFNKFRRLFEVHFFIV
jgi:hypothetical protein